MTLDVFTRIGAIIDDAVTTEWMSNQTDGELLDDVYDIIQCDKYTKEERFDMIAAFLQFAVDAD